MTRHSIAQTSENTEHSYLFSISTCKIMYGDNKTYGKKSVVCMQTGFGTLVLCRRKKMIFQNIGGKKREMIDLLY